MSLSPACLLMLGAEGFTRLFSLDHPEIYCAPFAEERIGLLRQDPDLFWSLMPGFRGIHRGVTMTINTMGLRSPEVVRKVAGERRILSLGESTTLGIAVADSETYSAQLERLLTAASPRRTVVINAGVSAYSSYQSLKYLETQGLALQPDIVLFYHEVNDYLPTTVRDANNTIGVGMTDRELDLSRLNKALRFLRAHSAFYRTIVFHMARFRAERFNSRRSGNPLSPIGIDPVQLPPRLYTKEKDGRMLPTRLVDSRMGTRVSESERLDNLTRLLKICRDRDIELILLHPSYSFSRPHECLLTHFCQVNGVTMLETYPLLHQAGTKSLYSDIWHPTAEGHRRLAAALARMIESRSRS